MFFTWRQLINNPEYMVRRRKLNARKVKPPTRLRQAARTKEKPSPNHLPAAQQVSSPKPDRRTFKGHVIPSFLFEKDPAPQFKPVPDVPLEIDGLTTLTPELPNFSQALDQPNGALPPASIDQESSPSPDLQSSNQPPTESENHSAALPVRIPINLAGAVPPFVALVKPHLPPGPENPQPGSPSPTEPPLDPGRTPATMTGPDRSLWVQPPIQASPVVLATAPSPPPHTGSVTPVPVGQDHSIHFQPGVNEVVHETGPGTSAPAPLPEHADAQPKLSAPPSSVSLPTPTGPPPQFWFNIQADLIIYGATENTAQLTLQGIPVPLRPDGTFSVRISLPDGQHTLDACATNATGQNQISAILKFTRDTHYL